MDNVEEWRKKSWLLQQDFYNQLYTRYFDLLDENQFFSKVEFAFSICYGEDFKSVQKCLSIYENLKEKLLVITNRKSEKYLSCAFINVKLKTDKQEELLQCVFRTKNNDDKEVLFDVNGRNYESWNDFLKNNVLPKAHIIYPKDGVYYNGTTNTEQFIDVKFEETYACSSRAVVKSGFDIVLGIGGVVGCGILFFNPVSLPIMLTGAALLTSSSVYSVGSNINNLTDISKHEGGLSLSDKKTLMSLADIGITSAGAAFIGAGTALKIKSATVSVSESVSLLSRSRQLITLGNSCCSVNVSINLMIIINKHRCNNVENKDITYLMNALQFSCNIFLTKLVAAKFIECAATFDVNDILEYIFFRSPLSACSYIKRAYNFFKEINLTQLFDLLLPKVNNYIERISISLDPIVKNISDIMLNTYLYITGKLGTPDYLYAVHLDLKLLFQNVQKYMYKCKLDLGNKFDKSVLKAIENWNTNYKYIDCCKNSQFDLRLNAPIKIQEEIKNTIKYCFKRRIVTDDYYCEKEKLLFSCVFKIITQHDMRDYEYCMGKVKYILNRFYDIYTKMLQLHFYESFEYKIKHNVSTEYFFINKMNIRGNINDVVFNRTIQYFQKHAQMYNDDFEIYYAVASSQVIPQIEQKKKNVYNFEMRSQMTPLTKDQYYEQVRLLIADAEERFTCHNSTCEEFFDSMAIIPVKPNFGTNELLYAYTEIGDCGLKGILIHVDEA